MFLDVMWHKECVNLKFVELEPTGEFRGSEQRVGGSHARPRKERKNFAWVAPRELKICRLVAHNVIAQNIKIYAVE